MVTGVGAIIGYGVLRSLRTARPDIRLLGADIYSDAVGQAWCDAFEQAPLTTSPAYLDWLQDVVARHKIHLIIPGIEQDLHRLSDAREFLAKQGCKIVLNTARLIDLSRDKWAMHEELVAIQDAACIPSYLSGDFDTLASLLGLPFLLKPRRSYASKGIVRVRSRDEFAQYEHRLGEYFLAQPIVGQDDQEYTVAAFGDGTGNIGASITLLRQLSAAGATDKAWVSQSDSLDQAVARLCAYFKPVGPTNLQFRKVDDGWKLLEINPRISSATSIRAAFGYNEASMCVDFFIAGKPISSRPLKTGFAIRYIEDYVIHDRNHF